MKERYSFKVEEYVYMRKKVTLRVSRGIFAVEYSETCDFGGIDCTKQRLLREHLKMKSMTRGWHYATEEEIALAREEKRDENTLFVD